MRMLTRMGQKMNNKGGHYGNSIKSKSAAGAEVD
jgi:hypothetical protein